MANGLGHSADEYYLALKSLLPQGPAWELSDDSFFSQMLMLASLEFARIDADIERLILQSDCRTASYTLDEWFNDWGIPDECLKLLDNATIEQYRQVLIAKKSTLGCSFLEIVKIIGSALGYSGVSIETYEPFTVGSRVNKQINNSDWCSYFMTVTTDETNVKDFRVDSYAYEALASWGDELFECLIKSIAPAYSGVIFQYGDN